MSKKYKEHRQDKSPHIEQRDKIKEDLRIRQFKWTPKQQEFIKTALDKNTKMIIANGLPGTSKTLLATYCILNLMNEKKLSDLIYIRSVVQAKDGQLGYLPGDLADRMQYYNIPIMDKLDELLPHSQSNQLVNDKRITCYPTSMLRGYNFAGKGVLLDEAVNLTFDSLLTVTTRVAEFSKLFVLGDTKYQNDLGKTSGFKKFVDIFNNEDCRKNGIFYFEFGKEDIMRSAFCKFVMEKVEDYEAIKDKSSMFPVVEKT